jgi:hypothetical protein
MLQLFKLFSARVVRARRAVAVVLMLAVVLMTPLHAETVSGLYTARGVVSDQSVEARREVLPMLLAEVVGRLVGEPDRLELQRRWPSLMAELQAAERYVGQFRYQTQETAEGQSELLLRVQFDESGLARLIQRLQLPQWGADRPEVLVVLAWQDGNRRDVLDSSPTAQLPADLATEVKQVAQRAGLPVALPLMDLQDQRDLPEQEVRAGFVDRLARVANRYGAQAVLLGRLRLANDAVATEFGQRGADVSWSLHQTNQATRYAEASRDVRGGLEAGVWMAARAMAERYALGAGEQVQTEGALASAAHVYVLGIENLSDLKKVQQHLFERTVVSDAALLEAKPWGSEKLTLFSVSLRGSVAKLEQALAVGRLLRPTSRPVDEIDSATTTVPLEDAGAGGRSRGRYNRAVTELAPPPATNELWYRLH